jgi:hypothetical protein
MSTDSTVTMTTVRSAVFLLFHNIAVESKHPSTMANEEMTDIADAVAARCLDLFSSLPANGKPLANQFTVLSGRCAVYYSCDL